MINLSNLGVSFIGAKHFKSIGETLVGINEIKPMNVLIGKNNSGKSSLLDVLERFIVVHKRRDTKTRSGNEPQFVHTQKITLEDIDTVFVVRQRSEIPTTRNRFVEVECPRAWARSRLLNKEMLCQIEVRANSGDRVLEYWHDGEPVDVEGNDKYIFEWTKARMVSQIFNPFDNFHFQRILADRDLVPEEDQYYEEQHSEHFPRTRSIGVKSNGEGFTRTVAAICHDDRYDRDLIEIDLLNSLNEILRPDCDFTRIVVERRFEKWEVILEEPKKGRICLSDMGSGVKTVLLVMMFLKVLPTLRKEKEVKNTIFGFEELENNLHPSIQRRLFAYLRSYAIQNDTCIFLTTHSNVVVDLFSKDKEAQLLHVTHDGECSAVQKVDCWKTGCSVLDDLGIRASDVLQANGIVWIEGPSDRIHFARWIELWTEGKLVEGVHFQCLPFGGNVGPTHFSFKSESDIEDLITALKVNKNAILLVDSDFSAAGESLKSDTLRLVEEVKAMGGISWVTQGREVENYIPFEALQSYATGLEKPGSFDDIPKKIKDLPGSVSGGKVKIARGVKEHLTRPMLENHMDMKDRLNEVAKQIAKWNEITLVLPE